VLYNDSNNPVMVNVSFSEAFQVTIGALQGDVLYLQHVQHLLGDIKGILQPNNIASLTQDRSDWRKLVAAAD
jgi:hypothetical protein